MVGVEVWDGGAWHVMYWLDVALPVQLIRRTEPCCGPGGAPEPLLSSRPRVCR